MTIRILIADDHAMFRQGLRALLSQEQDMEVVAEAEDGISAVERSLEFMPDVVVLDLTMGDITGIEAARQISERAPEIGIIVLTMHNNRQYIVEALKLGVKSFILKDWASDELITAVRSVYRKSSYLSPRLSDTLISGLIHSSSVLRTERLTLREEQAYKMLVSGKNCKEIAYDLQISCKTVESYRFHIMKKLKVSNMAQLVKRAVRDGLITTS